MLRSPCATYGTHPRCRHTFDCRPSPLAGEQGGSRTRADDLGEAAEGGVPGEVREALRRRVLPAHPPMSGAAAALLQRTAREARRARAEDWARDGRSERGDRTGGGGGKR
eukprot:397773-Rhodomonas_salina.1